MPTPSTTPPQRADEPHHRRLRRVDREDLPARCAEAAQNRHRVDLPHHEGMDAARDADAAEQQRDQSDDARDSRAAGRSRSASRDSLYPAPRIDPFVPSSMRLVKRATNELRRMSRRAA